MAPFQWGMLGNMDSLQREWQRLYLAAGSEAVSEAGKPVRVPFSATATTRVLALGFRRSADWESVARVQRAVQQDLDWPAPAVSVGQREGFTLWLSLAEAVSFDEAQACLKALVQRYLGDLPAIRIVSYPGVSDGRGRLAALDLPPVHDPETDKWSAFIDPTLGSMFASEAGLDLPPNRAQQAALLAGVTSISAEAFRHGLSILLPPAATVAAAAVAGGAETAEAAGKIGGSFSDPQAFLLAVMNDPATPLPLRIEAAKALLPYGRERA